jgi:hypothetical protein
MKKVWADRKKAKAAGKVYKKRIEAAKVTGKIEFDPNSPMPDDINFDDLPDLEDS